MRKRLIVLAFVASVAISGACGFGSSAPKVGDKDGFCSTAGSFKADNNGKWSCEPDDPNSPDSTKHWVKVG